MIAALSAIFSMSFVVALSGALMPGPLLTITVADSARRGFITGPLVILGHAILELALVIGVVAGLGKFLEIPFVIGTIALVGGGILLRMGIQMLREAGKLTLKTEAGEEPVYANPVLAGVIGSLTNPYWIIWWITIGLGYLIAAKRFGAVGVTVFFIGHILADFCWFSMISFGVSKGRIIMSDSVYRWIIRVCGAILLFFGCWFFYSSVGYYRG